MLYSPDTYKRRLQTVSGPSGGGAPIAPSAVTPGPVSPVGAPALSNTATVATKKVPAVAPGSQMPIPKPSPPPPPPAQPTSNDNDPIPRDPLHGPHSIHPFDHKHHGHKGGKKGDKGKGGKGGGKGKGGKSDVEKYLATDEQYQADRASLLANYRNLKATNWQNRQDVRTDFDTTASRLADEQAKALKAMQNDFAARGMFGGAEYLGAEGDFNKDYLNQNADATQSLNRNVAQLLTDLKNAGTLKDQNLQQARLEALRRRAAELGTRPGSSKGKGKGKGKGDKKDEDKKGGKGGKGSHQHHPGGKPPHSPNHPGR